MVRRTVPKAKVLRKKCWWVLSLNPCFLDQVLVSSGQKDFLSRLIFTVHRCTPLKILYRSDIVIGIHLRYVLYKESSLLQERVIFADFYVSLHRYYISLRQIGDKLGETGVFCLMKCTKFPTFSFKKLYKSLHIPSFWPPDDCFSGIYSPRCFIVGTV